MRYTGIVHSLSATAANVHDVTEAHGLLHGGETQVWCDAGYQGVHKREENLGREVEWQVAMRPGKRRKLDPGSAAQRWRRSARHRLGLRWSTCVSWPVKRGRVGATPRCATGLGEEHGSQVGASHISFSAPDVPALSGELESKGVPVAAPWEAWTNAQRTMESFYMYVPDEILV